MGQLSATSIWKALVSFFSALDTTDQDLVSKMLLRKEIRMEVTDGGTAGTAQGETVIWRNKTGQTYRVILAEATAPIAVTAHGTNNGTFDVSKRDGAGGGATSIGVFATDTVSTDDMVAFVPKAMTLTASAVLVPDGSVLTAKVTKGGTGVAIASATAQATVYVVVEPLV